MKSVIGVVIFSVLLHRCYGANYGGRGGGYRPMQSGSTASSRVSANSVPYAGYQSPAVSSSYHYPSTPGSPGEVTSPYRLKSTECYLRNIMDFNGQGIVTAAALAALVNSNLWIQNRLSDNAKRSIMTAVQNGGIVAQNDIFNCYNNIDFSLHRMPIDISRLVHSQYDANILEITLGFNNRQALQIMEGLPRKSPEEVATYLKNHN